MLCIEDHYKMVSFINGPQDGLKVTRYLVTLKCKHILNFFRYLQIDV